MSISENDNLSTTKTSKEHPEAISALSDMREDMSQAYTVFHMRESGAEIFCELDRQESILDVAQFVRMALCSNQESGIAAFQNAFPGLRAVTAEQYNQLMALRMESPNKIAGVFDLDFVKREFSVVDPTDGWKTYSMWDVSSAIYHAYRKTFPTPEQQMARFLDRLDGRELSSAGHLAARDISFDGDIRIINKRLNFYLEAVSDVDAIFGTNVSCFASDDELSICANFDMCTGQVCDELEVCLFLTPDEEEKDVIPYALNAIEKAILKREMDIYCQQQTGQSLKDYSAWAMTEGIAPQTQHVM